MSEGTTEDHLQAALGHLQKALLHWQGGGTASATLGLINQTQLALRSAIYNLEAHTGD